MSERSKSALPHDWLVLAIIGVIILSGATGYSAWAIAWGVMCLLARDTVQYWDMICKAWSLRSPRASLHVWRNLIGNALYFAFISYGIGFGLNKLFDIAETWRV